MVRTLLAGLLLLGALSSVLAEDVQNAGVLRGTVYDKDFGVPLPRVRVTIVEAGLTTVTNADGVFLFERVPPGTYTLTFTKDGYERALATGLSVTIGRLTDTKADLSAEVVELEELVVSGVGFADNSDLGLLEVRAVAVTVQDAISADFIRRAGVGDVAGALKLVTGASVVEGKYATVRGLSDRYTGVTLNGVRVPSADPRKRAAQIDLFPTGTIDSITVTKTFTPDLQGDFTGGGVDIRTKGIPDGPVFSVSAGLESNSGATNNDRFITYEGGGVDASGFQDGSRDLPEVATGPYPAFPRLNPRTITQQDKDNAAVYDAIAHSFVPVMGSMREAPGYNNSFSLVAGNRFRLGAGKLGLIGALSYSHKYDFYENATNNSGVVSTADGTVTVKDRSDTKGTDEVLMGLLGSAVYQPNDDHEFSLKLIGNHSATDEARYQVLAFAEFGEEQNQSLQYAERDVASLQLQGRNRFASLLSPSGNGRFGDLSLVWSLSGNYTRQDEPDVRFFRNYFDLDTFQSTVPANSTEPQNTRRIWRRIEEKNRQGALDLELPFVAWGEQDAKLKFGGFYEHSDRDYTQTSFTYMRTTQFPAPGSAQAVAYNNGIMTGYVSGDRYGLWTDVFADPERTGLAPNRCEVSDPPCTTSSTQLLWWVSRLKNDVSYGGAQEITAFYGMAELPIARGLKFIGGLRRERTSLTIEPFSEIGTVQIIVTDENLNRTVLDVPQDQGRASIDDGKPLPAAGLIWELRARMNLRASYGKTLARPTFRELAPVATEEFIFGDEFLGNPELVASSIENLDVRWEWFPGPGQVLAASAFFKTIENPIEYISFGANNRSFIQPVNYDTGEVKGLEVEARSGFEIFSDRLRNFSAGMNATYINSSVDVPLDEQLSLDDYALNEETRRLQGQPSYIANFNLTYDSTATGTSFGVFYNMVGETLQSGAARGNEDGVPNVIEKPFATLDVTASQKIGRHMSIAAKATNVLAEERDVVYRVPDGRETLKSRRKSTRNVSIGVSYKW